MASSKKMYLRGQVPAKCLNPNRKKIRVLVVEDDNEDFFVVKRLLDRSHENLYVLTHVASYFEAILELKNEVYDVVLLDFYIEGGSAKEVFTALGSRWSAPVIIFTGSEDAALEQEMLEAGAFDFLKKGMLTTESLILSFDFAIRRYAVERNILAQQERLRRERENAEAAHYSKSEFLAYFGNEIKTPLNAIAGFSQVMKGDVQAGGTPHEYQRYSQTIYDSSQHLINMIEDLLDLSETDADSFDARHHRFKRFRTWIVDQRAAQTRVAKTVSRAAAS